MTIGRRTAIRAALAAMLATAAATAACAGTIQGRILDEVTGEAIIGAGVFVVDTDIGGYTDLDGHYRLDGVPAGGIELRITCEFYQAKVVTELALAEDEALALDVSLAPVTEEGGDGRAFHIEDLRVSASRVLSTPTAILANRMAAPTIGDAISAAQISMSPAATSGDALTRVTGLMMVDDKYVFIRGMPDRYNTTQLDGVAVVGVDIDRDRKSFAYDLVPAELLANMEVQKSATPDMPGDLSGGTVKINTLEFPTERIFRFSAASGTNSLTTGKEFLASAGGGDDWLADDDGSRALPASLRDLPVNLASPNNGVDRALRTGAAGADLPNNYRITPRTARPGKSLNMVYGDRWFVRDIDELGLVASLTYRNSYEIEGFHDDPTRVTVIDMPEGFDDLVFETKDYDLEGVRYGHKYQVGGLLNLNYKLALRHKLQFANFYNRSALDRITIRSGLPHEGQYGENTSFEWKERSLQLGKLHGEHSFGPDHRLRLEWTVWRYDTRIDEPDRRYVEFDQQPSAPGSPVRMALRDNYRMWNANHEETDGRRADIAVEAFGAEWKFGVLDTERRRDVEQLAYTYDKTTIAAAARGILEYGLDSIFIPEHVSWAADGTNNRFAFDLATGFFGTYEAAQDLTALYLMADREFALGGAKFRLVAGVRREDSRIEVVTPPTLENTETVRAVIDGQDVLPSANLTWRAGGNANVRLAYARSVNRPEFRELSPIRYYNFAEDRNILGNPALVQAGIENWDLRCEFFPEAGEVLAVSGFWKDFTNAIEDTLQSNPERFVQTWTNSPKARNYGFELEARKNLGFLGGFLDGFTLTANYFRVQSDVDYVLIETDAEGEPVATAKTRPLQGQAPWAVNISLLWERPAWGSSVNVLFNRIGRRLDKVGDTEETSVYLMPRDLVDVAWVQQLGDTWRMKFAVKNLLDKQEEYLWGTRELPFGTRAYGMSSGLSFTYSY